jgi:hypothetical protein
VGSLEGRISRLEEHIGPTEPSEADPTKALRSAILRDIMAEFGRLKASRATGVFRGGDPTPIEPEDIPGQVLGPGYTTGQMMELAIRRVFERERGNAPDVLSGDEVENLIKGWTDVFEAFFARQAWNWNKVEE